MATPIENIGQIAIRARDLPEAVRFYRDVLGLDYLFEAGALAFFMCGDVRLMLSPPEQDEFDHPAPRCTSAYRTSKPPTASCRPRGATFVDEPHLIAKLPDHELWMAFFRDPDGNLLLALMSEVPRELRTVEASSPRSSGTVTLTRDESACRAAEYVCSASWESTLSAITSPPGSSFGRASANNAS